MEEVCSTVHCNYYKFQYDKSVWVKDRGHYILLLFMKISICVLLGLLLLAATVTTQGGDSTTLTYFVDYEEEQEEDFIEAQILIQSQSQQLTAALNQAKQAASEVARIASDYCKQYTKKGKGDCKEAVDAGNYQIEPKYQQVRKENVFTAFVVSYEITINVYAPENIGILIDTLLKLPDLTIKGFEWKPLEEKDSEEEAIKQGVEQGEGLCNQVGLTLGRIIDIEEVVQEEQEQKGGDEEEEEQEEPEITTYKFEVECVKGKKAK